ncbi:AAA family ATPase [Alloiococcus sp. CFN-8]|uniref:AAA family ATPase n=1 Tax=Alloiococcus sp. CFN-8 TaxID=3416081 RepID=UPI003CF95A3A
MENSRYITAAELARRIKIELKKAVVEQEEIMDQAIISLISGGHVLIEGVPGLAKTMLIKALARTLSLDFKRIQFTPDLMPADITGTKVFNMQNREFEMVKGPVFTNFLLADEINRTPPKTQAGLLESMAENTVSVDGEMLPLPNPYMVFATENPLEYEGTYPLPEALVDRFIMKLLIDYPSSKGEKEVLMRHNQGFLGSDLNSVGIEALYTAEDIIACRKEVQGIRVEEGLIEYIVNIIKETRNNPTIEIGSSPRGSIALLQCSKGCAAFMGRDYVIPEDIKRMALPTLRHRIILKPELELEGVKPDEVLQDILSKLKVPR